jgi:hypothetical protein
MGELAGPGAGEGDVLKDKMGTMGLVLNVSASILCNEKYDNKTYNTIKTTIREVKI